MVGRVILALVLVAGFVALASGGDQAQGGWLRFVDRVHGFSFEYPSKYRRQHTAGAEMLGLLMSAEPSWANEPDRGKASISVMFSNSAFSLTKLISEAPTGVIEPPAPVQFGAHTFYYYGPGGGGVAYYDRYYFNLHGRTLKLVFDGPYNGSKSPVEETKQIERRLLASLGTF